MLAIWKGVTTMVSQQLVRCRWSPARQINTSCPQLVLVNLSVFHVIWGERHQLGATANTIVEFTST